MYQRHTSYDKRKEVKSYDSCSNRKVDGVGGNVKIEVAVTNL